MNFGMLSCITCCYWKSMHMCVTVPIVQTSPVEIGHDIKPHMLLSKVTGYAFNCLHCSNHSSVFPVFLGLESVLFPVLFYGIINLHVLFVWSFLNSFQVDGFCKYGEILETYQDRLSYLTHPSMCKLLEVEFIFTYTHSFLCMQAGYEVLVCDFHVPPLTGPESVVLNHLSFVWSG